MPNSGHSKLSRCTVVAYVVGASVISVEEARDENRLDSASFREKGKFP